jgi:hypothetical protein
MNTRISKLKDLRRPRVDAGDGHTPRIAIGSLLSLAVWMPQSDWADSWRTSHRSP